MSPTEVDEPEHLADFRARRETLKQERLRQKAWENRSTAPPGYGREIPPRLNPDVPEMVDEVMNGCFGLRKWIGEFQHVVTELRDHDLLDPRESGGLLKHYDHLQEAVDATIEAVLRVGEVAAARETLSSSFEANLIADHAKYVYAVGTRDIAAMQYLLAELAGTGRIDLKEEEELQSVHCVPMWWTLYDGTTSAVRDYRTWDGGWEWSDNTYSDGRQVMTQVRVTNWHELNSNWPYKKFLSGDGPICAHPRGTLCQIAPMIDPENDKGDLRRRYHLPVEIDLEALTKQFSAPVRPKWVIDHDLEAAAYEAAMLELSYGPANTEASS